MSRLMGSGVLWDGTAASGAAGNSLSGYAGSKQNVSLYIANKDGSTSTTITIYAANGNTTAGMNATPAAADWHQLLKDDGTGVRTITVAANTNLCLNLSNFVPSWFRLQSSANVILKATFEASNT